MQGFLRGLFVQRSFIVLVAIFAVLFIAVFTILKNPQQIASVPTSSPSPTLAPTVTLTSTSTPRPSATMTPTVTLTSTPTLTPTATFTPTFTPVPTLQNPAPSYITEGLPKAFNASDIAIMNTNYLLHITKIIRTDTIGRFHPSSPNNIYLLIEANLWNASDTSQGFFDTDFEINYRDSFRVDAPVSGLLTANVDLMGEAKGANYASDSADWPNKNWVLTKMVLPPKSTRRMILAYEIPLTARIFTLFFHPANLNPKSIQLYIEPQEGTTSVSFVKLFQDESPLYRVVDIVEGDTIAISPHSSFNMLERLENCQKQEIEAEFKRQTESKQFSSQDVQFSGDIKGINFLALIAFGASLDYGTTTKSDVTEQRSLSFKPVIQPGKALELREYTSDVEKIVDVTIELNTGERFSLPYRIRGIETTTSLEEVEAVCNS
jgi:hypothetical protein